MTPTWRTRFTVDVPTALVPARVAAVIEQRFELHELREEVYKRRDREAYEVLHALHAIASQYAAEQEANVVSSGRGSAIDAGSEVPADSSSMKALGTSEVARAAGVTSRAVTLAANDGRLKGQQVGGRWWFWANDVAEWITRRAG